MPSWKRRSTAKFGSNQKSLRASLDCTALKAPLRQIQATSQDRSGDEHTASRAGEASAADLRVPRVAKLMTQAVRFDGSIRDEVVRDQAELVKLGHVTRARLMQIMAFLNLAPDIQEAILMMPAPESGRDPVTEKQLRPVAALLGWREQLEMWEGMGRGDRTSDA
jgi:hypothetical protein